MELAQNALGSKGLLAIARPLQGMQGKNEKQHLMLNSLNMSDNSVLIWKLCVFLVVEVEAKKFMLGECRAAVLKIVYTTGHLGEEMII